VVFGVDFDKAIFQIGILDRLSYRNTVIHRLDPRTKVIAAFALIVTVVSFQKYEIAGLIPFFLFPVVVFALGEIPARFILKKVLLVSVFAVFIGLFNPLVDTRIMYRFGGVAISAGWVSFLSILLRFVLTALTMLLLISTTSFPGVSFALGRLGVPQVFVSQLHFLYRYIFVLLDEGMHMVRARDVRCFDRRGRSLWATVSLIGTLFVRTVERAERIHNAMISRGFTGVVRLPGKYRMKMTDFLSLACVGAILVIFRMYDIVHLIGAIAQRMF
jgi:cobalt/nickel transport system permease protein